jgi:acetyl esterase/lipase
MEVGGLDLFRDENIAYAAKLTSANVEVEFHLYPGLFHAYDGLAPNITMARASEENIFKFIRGL